MTEFLQASVTRDPTGIYILQWSLRHPQAVTVFRSDSAAGEFQCLGQTEQSHMQVDLPADLPRQHFLLQAGDIIMPLAERRLPVQGTPNLRDFGGYKTGDGRHVRWGHFYRSGRLSALTQADQQYIQQLGIGHIFDFRRQQECDHSPTLLRPEQGFQICHLPIGEGSHTGFINQIRKAELSARQASQGMVELYADLALKHGAEYRQVFQHMLSFDNPFLIHCTAGKDRTGVGTALILMLMGVDRDTIVEDYLLTSKFYPGEEDFQGILEQLEASHLAEASLRELLAVKPEYIDGFFRAIADNFQSDEEYFAKIHGLTPEFCDAIRQRHLI